MYKVKNNIDLKELEKFGFKSNFGKSAFYGIDDYISIRITKKNLFIDVNFEKINHDFKYHKNEYYNYDFNVLNYKIKNIISLLLEKKYIEEVNEPNISEIKEYKNFKIGDKVYFMQVGCKEEGIIKGFLPNKHKAIVGAEWLWSYFDYHVDINELHKE